MTSEGYRKIYELLDSVSPVPFDCGRICGQACCRTDEDGAGIFLLPGEEGIRKTEEWDSVEPVEGCLFVRCKGPEYCRRSTRPMQCRTFPLFPTIGPEGELVLSKNTMDLPYSCPLIDGEAVLDPDFVHRTGQVWQELLEDPAVCDLVRKWGG